MNHIYEKQMDTGINCSDGLCIARLKSISNFGHKWKLFPKGACEIFLAIRGYYPIIAIPANGVFMLEAKPGIYRVIVDAKQSPNNVLVESIEVTSGRIIDLGEIKISQ